MCFSSVSAECASWENPILCIPAGMHAVRSTGKMHSLCYLNQHRVHICDFARVCTIFHWSRAHFLQFDWGWSGTCGRRCVAIISHKRKTYQLGVLHWIPFLPLRCGLINCRRLSYAIFCWLFGKTKCAYTFEMATSFIISAHLQWHTRTNASGCARQEHFWVNMNTCNTEFFGDYKCVNDYDLYRARTPAKLDCVHMYVGSAKHGMQPWLLDYCLKRLSPQFRADYEHEHDAFGAGHFPLLTVLSLSLSQLHRTTMLETTRTQ